MMEFRPNFEGWQEKGFSKHSAERWSSSGFDLKQAKQWEDNGFSLDSAISFRKEGIGPSEVKRTIINEIKSDLL